MALSVLRTPPIETQNSFIFMLIETSTDEVLAKGGIDEMYDLKNLLEETEQVKDNEQWMAKIFAKRLKLVTGLMKDREAAERILKINMSEKFYLSWQKYKNVL